jgi:hypothetical protein
MLTVILSAAKDLMPVASGDEILLGAFECAHALRMTDDEP